ncbi:Multiple C2 and transmembrane domain-containing protein 2 [Homalodisca vitripennis]|nr:Multiple C2 and transmembrane domain-containing protein 2 [Homalodisca vitripennis]
MKILGVRSPWTNSLTTFFIVSVQKEFETVMPTADSKLADNLIKQRRAWLLLGWVIAERSCPCKQPPARPLVVVRKASSMKSSHSGQSPTAECNSKALINTSEYTCLQICYLSLENTADRWLVTPLSAIRYLCVQLSGIPRSEAVTVNPAFLFRDPHSLHSVWISCNWLGSKTSLTRIRVQRLSHNNQIKQRRAWLLLGCVTAERSCPCKQPACPAVGGGSEVTFGPQEKDELTRQKESQLRQHSFFQLRVHLKRGKDLIARDKSGTSDPYVKFKSSGRLLYKSKTIYRDLNPIWDESFILPIEDPFNPIQIKVFDYDWGLQDDFMGSAYLDLTKYDLGKPTDVVLTLRDVGKAEYLGEIHLTATLWPKSQEDKEQLWKSLFRRPPSLTVTGGLRRAMFPRSPSLIVTGGLRRAMFKTAVSHRHWWITESNVPRPLSFTVTSGLGRSMFQDRRLSPSLVGYGEQCFQDRCLSPSLVGYGEQCFQDRCLSPSLVGYGEQCSKTAVSHRLISHSSLWF